LKVIGAQASISI